MAQVCKLPNYKKSGCNNCNDNPIEYYYKPYDVHSKDFIPTSLFTTNCKNDIDNTYRITRIDQEPQVKLDPKPYTLLNENFGLTLRKDFKQGKDGHWYSEDPRTRRNFLNESIPLDRPAYTTDVQLKNIYTDPELNNYGKNYKTYSDINAGQYQYYLDTDMIFPYDTPVFSIDSQVVKSVFKDPMGGMIYQFDRYPYTMNNQAYSDYQVDRDQLAYREDLLSRGLRRTTSWQSAWGLELNQLRDEKNKRKTNI
jgi:hypothetical protein